VKRIALVTLALAVAAARPARAESPREGSFELSFGQYKPDIDSEFANKPGRPQPWRSIFGSSPGWMLKAGVAKSLFTGVGTLDVGFQVGYFTKTGFGIGLATGLPSGDQTTFRMIPTSATLTYRFDLLADRYHVPLAPYGRVTLERYNWWVTDGAGTTSQRGATNGWSAAAGLALLLDFFDPGLARELDNESGINHTYLFGEVRKSWVDDFGSSRSWNLSDSGVAWNAGLLFVF
jgi:hypothetical protein